MKILLGNPKNPDNHIKLSHHTISRSHLEIEQIDQQQLLIKNLSLTNPTIVDGIQIDTCKVTFESEITLGDKSYSGEWLFKKVQEVKNADRIDFTTEIQELEPVFKEFSGKLKKIKQQHLLKRNGYRLGIMLLIIIPIYILFPKLDPAIRIIISMGIGSALGIIITYFIKSDELQKQIRVARKKFKIKLSCPKCEFTLINYTYREVLEEKECPNCGCYWNKE